MGVILAVIAYVGLFVGIFYGWLINLQNILSQEVVNVMDAPFAAIGIIIVPLGTLIGYLGW